MSRPLSISVTVGLVLLAAETLFTAGVNAQSIWKQHDMNRPRPPVVVPAAHSLPVPAPSDAVVLFDGTDLSQWLAVDGGPARWRVADGTMVSVAGARSIQTMQAFGDVQLHVEWAAPVPAAGGGQGRGNSGVFLMGLYEVQILDSYENDTYPDGQAAAIYGQHPPLVNATRPPGEWQSYDIYFRGPRFSQTGALQEPARLTVVHNGVLVQNNVEPFGPTMWLKSLPYERHPAKLPLQLQDHGNPVRFRNIWVRELPQLEELPPADAYAEPVITLTPAQLDRYPGQYRTWTVRRDGNRLLMNFYGPEWLELIPHSPTTFSLRYTAGTLVFELDDESTPTQVTFHLGGETTVARRRD